MWVTNIRCNRARKRFHGTEAAYWLNLLLVVHEVIFFPLNINQGGVFTGGKSQKIKKSATVRQSVSILLLDIHFVWCYFLEFGVTTSKKLLFGFSYSLTRHICLKIRGFNRKRGRDHSCYVILSLRTVQDVCCWLAFHTGSPWQLDRVCAGATRSENCSTEWWHAPGAHYYIKSTLDSNQVRRPSCECCGSNISGTLRVRH